MSSDIVTGLVFVDPAAVETTFRVGLYAAPGSGKSVAAASAPTPILVVSLDRPAAYRFARTHHGHSAADLREVRYTGPETLSAVYRYLDSDEGRGIKTLVVDPVTNLYDDLRVRAPKRSDGDTDYEWVNRQVMNFVTGLRRFDVHVVLVAHEKLNDGKKGDGRAYPAFGGMTLINKVMAELDICARIERVEREVEGSDDPEVLWVGSLQPRGQYVCKDGTNALGARRVADLSRWFAVANAALAPDEDDLPWTGPPAPDDDSAADAAVGALTALADGEGDRPALPEDAPLADHYMPATGAKAA